MYRSSDDGGDSWSPPSRIDTGRYDPYGHGAVSLVADADAVHLFFTRGRNTPSPNKVMHQSTRDGTTWSDPVRVDRTSVSQRFQYSVDLHAGVLHFARQRAVENGEVVLYRHSLDGGATWSKRQRLVGPGPGHQFQDLDLAAWNRNVHFVFARNDRVRYRHSADYGTTWTKPSKLTKRVHGSQIDATRRWVHLAAETPSGVTWLRSNNHGDTWSNLGPVTGYPNGWTLHSPAIVADGRYAHLALIGEKDVEPYRGRVRVYYQRYR